MLPYAHMLLVYAHALLCSRGAQWWAFEGIYLMVGSLPDSEQRLAVHAVLFNSSVIFMVAAKGG